MKTNELGIAVLPYKKGMNEIFQNARPADLSEEDMILIEEILMDAIKTYTSLQEKNWQEFIREFPDKKEYKKHFFINLERYRRQYIACINAKGEKEVWVNCFCEDFGKNWKKEIILVSDGGNCFFNLKINLTTKKYYNGEA